MSLCRSLKYVCVSLLQYNSVQQEDIVTWLHTNHVEHLGGTRREEESGGGRGREREKEEAGEEEEGGGRRRKWGEEEGEKEEGVEGLTLCERR